MIVCLQLKNVNPKYKTLVFPKFRSSHQKCSMKKVFLEISCNFTKKETLALMFSCEFCEISKKTFFTEHL